MSLRLIGTLALACAAWCVFSTLSFGQGAGGGGGGGGTTTTVTTQQVAGVIVDADGVLKMHKFADPGGRLTRTRIASSRARLDPKIASRSKLRKISLNRMEQAAVERMERGEPLADDMLYLAGMTRLQYVFFYPETNDIVIAGPAEGWATDLSGRVRGYETGRPVIELQDLVVALRSFPPGAGETPVVSCSIDPTQEGLQNMQQFLRAMGGRAVPSQTRRIINGLRKSLGLQTITLKGIPADTHFAEVLVEADYRMKMIGIGLERTRVKNLKSYVDFADPATVARNALRRWYFVPNYECVRISDDELGMELVGQGVKLVGADELVTADGSRVGAGSSDRASKKFVHGFTKMYPELAAKVPVYAQLRNCIDLVVAAAFIREQDFYGRAGWLMDVFGDEAAFSVQSGHAPEKVESAVAAYWRGSRRAATLMTPIGGGVNIQPRLAFSPENLLNDEQGHVAAERQEISIEGLGDGQWWWD